MDYTELIKEDKLKDLDEKLKTILQNPLKNKPTIEEAIKISKLYDVPLHPEYIFYWTELSIPEFILLLELIFKYGDFDNEKLSLILPKSKKEKRSLEILGVEHKIQKNDFTQIRFEKFSELIVIDEVNTKSLLINLGYDYRKDLNIKEFKELIENIIEFSKENLSAYILDIINYFTFVEIKDKAGTYIGARMGRPEKAKMRKKFLEETNSVGLFPVGDVGGRNKNIVEIFDKYGYIEGEFRTFFCEKCNRETIFGTCEICGFRTKQLCFERYSYREIIPDEIKDILKLSIELYDENKGKTELKDELINDLKSTYEELEEYTKKHQYLTYEMLESIKSKLTTIVHGFEELSKKEQKIKSRLDKIKKVANSVYYKKQKYNVNFIKEDLRKKLGSDFQFPKSVKGIKSAINKHHSIEHVMKAFLRNKYGLTVNKDGTIRYDMIEMGFTHFKPKEIGTSIEKLKELGYSHDYLGNELKDENQIVEIFPQDVALPDCKESGDELASDYILKTAKYIDELLVKLYGLEPYYNYKTKEDTIGTLIIGLAPHISAGIIGRVIGYTKTQGCFSHPVWHAAQRRNLDGDENGIMLLLDALINFSKEYLPDRRGTRSMDVPLVLTSHLYLDQIDDEVHGMDIVPYYPLEFYKACKDFLSPKQIKIENVGKRIYEKELDKQYFGYKFTHNVTDMNSTVLCSSYKLLPTMKDKLNTQIKLAKIIRAVNEDEVGTFIIEKHFMKDIKGNFRKFSQQTFRCTNCNTIYRRPPLNGKCHVCKKPSINFTIHEGSIKKYLSSSFEIMERLNVRPYTKETVELINVMIDTVFGKKDNKQKSLNDFFKK